MKEHVAIQLNEIKGKSSRLQNDVETKKQAIDELDAWCICDFGLAHPFSDVTKNGEMKAKVSFNARPSYTSFYCKILL